MRFSTLIAFCYSQLFSVRDEFEIEFVVGTIFAQSLASDL
jgi:hypothetical protein